MSLQQLNFRDGIQPKVQQRGARCSSGIDYEDRDTVDVFLKLPVPKRKIICEVILTFAKMHSELRNG